MELFKTAEVLFESHENDESLKIECYVTEAGHLLIEQVSAGALTQWCFEESPHRVVTEVGASGAVALAAHFGAVEPAQLPCLIGASYLGYDVCSQIHALLRELGVPYEVRERPIVR
ncbi:MAG: hypothetical protein E7001_07570 [Coriobacteriaceae bacterium]|nr:hypothetical protein [Coriobacteriaceae bacterium]